MIFVTLGSQKFQFNRLLEKIDALVEEKVITDEMFAQIGYSDYHPKNYQYKDFLNRNEFASMEGKADIVITHGGTGAIIGAVKKGKKVIAVPRMAKYGEHVDDHQIQLLKQFECMSIIEACYQIDDLSNALYNVKHNEYKTYKSNTEKIIESIEYFINGNEYEKIKVLMVGNSPSVKGGITSVISQILEHDWYQDGIEMKFIPTYVNGNNISKIVFFLHAYCKIKHEFQHNKPDVVHIHMSYRGSFTRKYMIHQLCRENGIPDIIHLHGSEFEKWYNEVDNEKKEKIKKMMRECRAFIVLGNKWNHVIKKIEPLTNTIIISNTVQIPNEMTKWNSSPFQLLFLGVLIKRKGVEDLLEAVANLVYENGVDNIKLVIAGTGDEEQNLKSSVARLKIENYVDFAGWTDGKKKQELLLKSQLLILPSYNEGLPIAILEAMSYGLPVISTDVGDISSAVHDGENGYLVTPGNIKWLTDRIYRIISDKELCNEFSRESRRIVISEFSDTEYFGTIKRCYNELRS